MKPTKTFVHNWIVRYEANIEHNAPDGERRELNALIKEIAFNGCDNQRMQRAAELMIYLSRTRVGGEPLQFLKDVCNGRRGLDVVSFLNVVEYCRRQKC